MKQTTIIAIVLGVLVLLSVVQVFQLSSLKTKVAEGEFTTSSSSSKVSVASGSESAKKTASLPSSLQDLPQMVGGC